MKEGFPEYSFELDRQNQIYCRIFVKYRGVTLGRLNFKYGELTHFKNYKPSDYNYEMRDSIFYNLYLYLNTGKRIDLSPFIEQAKELAHKRINEIKQWRKDHPKYDKDGNLKSRPKIRTNWMYFFRSLVSEAIQQKFEQEERIGAAKLSKRCKD